MSKRLTESQIFGISKEAEAGRPVPKLCRKYAIGKSSFYKQLTDLSSATKRSFSLFRLITPFF